MSAKGRSETWTRALTGSVFVVVVMGAVATAWWSNAILWVLVALLAWVEWFRAPQVLGSTWPKALLALFPIPALAALLWMSLGGPHPLDPYDPWPILSFVWMIWANDTGAYIVGKPLGKHKLWPSVSPGKSWEGFVGGVAVAAGVAWATLGLEFWWLGALMGVLSTAGDLTQSAWKRRRGMKDSGTLLPGHGGILDRFDGFLYAAPVYVLLYCIFAA